MQSLCIGDLNFCRPNFPTFYLNPFYMSDSLKQVWLWILYWDSCEWIFCFHPLQLALWPTSQHCLGILLQVVFFRIWETKLFCGIFVHVLLFSNLELANLLVVISLKLYTLNDLTLWFPGRAIGLVKRFVFEDWFSTAQFQFIN